MMTLAFSSSNFLHLCLEFHLPLLCLYLPLLLKGRYLRLPLGALDLGLLLDLGGLSLTCRVRWRGFGLLWAPVRLRSAP